MTSSSSTRTSSAPTRVASSGTTSRRVSAPSAGTTRVSSSTASHAGATRVGGSTPRISTVSSSVFPGETVQIASGSVPPSVSRGTRVTGAAPRRVDYGRDSKIRLAPEPPFIPPSSHPTVTSGIIDSVGGGVR